MAHQGAAAAPSSPLAAAILWDLDGTILATEELYDAAIQQALRRLGWNPSDEDIRAGGACHGMTLENELVWWRERAKPTLIDEAGLLAEFWKAFAHVADTAPSSMPVLPGVREAVLAASSLGVPQALATMSTLHEVDIKKGAAPDIFGCLAAVVAADSPGVDLPKPSPDVYLVAARALGVDPRDCVVVEDTARGAGAGAAAGCAVVAVNAEAVRGGEVEAALLAAGAEVVLRSLEELPPDGLATRSWRKGSE
jgi:beta-phosphoglucomutase-like phosphatase (HAD superfamily)